MLSSVRIGINSGSAIIERALDIPGYVPFVGTFSGALRVGVGAAQLCLSSAIAAIYLLGELFNALSSRKIEGKTLYQWRQMCLDNGINAVGNLRRGLVEMIPFLNLLLIKYDVDKAKEIQSKAPSQVFSPGFDIPLPQVFSPELNVPLLPSLLMKAKSSQLAVAGA